MKLNQTTILNGAFAFAAGMLLWTVAQPYVNKLTAKLPSAQ